MKGLIFRKRFEFADAPGDWAPLRSSLDWSGNPLLLMVEGRGNKPSFRKDPEAWYRWNRTPAKAHHVIYWTGKAMRSVRLENYQGIGSSDI